ncbi:AAA family ATPase [Tropicimonas sp. IMCC34011]|uniref:AAA family ATPase n=1 Tax=Tropicimonas sp. IMCC34011 TaxID=2248759 RepID=UPI000E2593A4|nr:AAA family ATPase [Tropicimonas sp. IMCC34011]
MQILSIRGENIASLGKPFEIRLDEGPLASAGLFAITGETGAGKSSLLDAMCLALYGDCPRLSGGGTREAVADVDGATLRSTDPRMVLRRGAARGMAEVTFRAVDGEVYTAGWSARRARDRIEGRLQAADRSLIRASDGQVLESQLSRVNDRVSELTGLTYDEFRRTVLLAQGDFDAFLSAQTGERAAILEKVTGTQVYRDISRRVYERHAAAQSTLATLETRRGEHRLLSAEDRAALEAEGKSLRDQQATTAADLAVVLADLGRYVALETAKAAFDRAEARVGAAETALTELTDQQAWLADWDRAQALRSEVREDQAAAMALHHTTDAVARLTETHAAQTGTVAERADEATDAATRLDQIEALFKALGPDWTAAEQLDGQIATATRELASAEADQAARQDNLAAAQTSQEALDAQDRDLQTALTQAAHALQEIPGQDVLLAQWTALEDRLEARIQAATRLHAAEAALGTLHRADQDQTTARDKARAEAETVKTGLAELRRAQSELQPERLRLQAEDPAGRLATLAQHLIDLRSLRQATAQLREAERALSDSAELQRRALTDRTTAEADQTRLTAELETARHHVDALSRPVASAEAALSAEADHLRQHLQPGAPCPVCHATEHPVMENSALARLAEDLRQQMQAATDARDAAQAGLRDAQAWREAAQAAITREENRAAELTAARASAQDDHARQCAALDGTDMPLDPQAPDEAFTALLARLDAARVPLDADRDRLKALEQEHQRLGAAIEAGLARQTTLADQITTLTEGLADSEARARDLTRDLTADTREIVALAPRLTPPLAALGLTPDAFGADGQLTLDRLRDSARRAATLRQQMTDTGAARAELLPRLTEAREATRSAGQLATEAQQARDRRRSALDDLTAQRAELLGGEPTGVHRTRHNEARKAAMAAATEAQRLHADAASRLAGDLAGLTAAQDALTSATARQQAATTALTVACEAAGLDLARVQTLHAASTEDVDHRRATLDAARTERTSAEGARQERREELARLQEAELPETPRPDLEARKARLEATATTLTEAVGRLAERREADARASAALSGLLAKIEAARSLAETWTAMNEAIGSARGDRFTQIAQAVTLAMLVERANLHLDQLKPRYQLAVADQDLALHIIDRDMAGDTRPSRLLSGGERFLVSLSLALALSGMGSRGALAGTLFIDEGFGSLDAESLDLAIDALERLQAQGRTIGVISHVQAMKDRIPVQLEVTKTGGGASEVALRLA